VRDPVSSRGGMIWLKRFVKRGLLGSVLLPRRFHAYCVGAAKSGTVSVSAMFSTKYRAAHEAQFYQIIELAILRLEGRLTTESAKNHLRRRDRELRLEMDSCNHLAFFAKELVEEFPEALFLLTVRQPRPWLESIINQHLRVDVTNRQPEKRFRELSFSPPGVNYTRGEEELERLGVFPLEGYLRAWSAHYERVLNAVPADRLLVIETEKLASSTERIERFLFIHPGTIDIKRSHQHRTPRDYGVINRLPAQLVEEKIALHCSPVLSRVRALMDYEMSFHS